MRRVGASRSAENAASVYYAILLRDTRLVTAGHAARTLQALVDHECNIVHHSVAAVIRCNFHSCQAERPCQRRTSSCSFGKSVRKARLLEWCSLTLTFPQDIHGQILQWKTFQGFHFISFST